MIIKKGAALFFCVHIFAVAKSRGATGVTEKPAPKRVGQIITKKIKTMKKLFIAMLALAAIGSATAYAIEMRNESATIMLDSPAACVEVGNVTASVDENGRISFYNSNSYRVSVSYTVTALTSDYRRIEVGGGSVTLGRAGNGSACIAHVDTTSGFSGYSVTIKVQKCS